MIKILGIDIGYSKVKKTSCYCIFSIDNYSKEISFISEPEKYGLDFNVKNITLGVDLITIDAPLTPNCITSKPQTGRKIDKLFSNDIFNNSKKGIQPSSIAVPMPGWQLYMAGMNLVSSLTPILYHEIIDNQDSRNVNVYEVIPKLSQALLVPRQIVMKREKNQQLDDYLYPMLFPSQGIFNHILNNLLGDYRFDRRLQKYIDMTASHPQKYHEELASIVCAFQGTLIYLNNASIIGFKGEQEGYYALPNKNFWDDEWETGFSRVVNKNFKDVIIL